MYGVNIDKGPQNWQIIQQENGFGEIELEGHIEFEQNVYDRGNMRVYVRIVDENSGCRVTDLCIADLKDDKWKAKIKVPAGGPYRLESYLRFYKNWERRGDRIFHLGVGDIYVICGQSNAVGVAKDVARDEVSLDVHTYRHSGKWDVAAHPLNDSTDTIYPEIAETVQCGASPWITFGKVLSKKLGYPIGLIPTAVGGTPLSFWNKRENGKLFDSMKKVVNDAANGKIKGILWSQGCNDAETSNEEERITYLERFKDVCKDFEDTFYKGIPILTVQLNKVVCTKTADLQKKATGFAKIREAQRKAAKEISNVYVVPSIDQMVCDGIHNSAMSVIVIGERVANSALKYVYGKQIICDAPDIRSAEIVEQTKVVMHFDNVYDLIDTDVINIENMMFSVTDEAGRITPCDYDFLGDDSLVLFFDRKIEKNATLNCDGFNDTGLIPYELYSYLPIMPFNDFKLN